MNLGPLISVDALVASTTPVRLLDARPGAEVHAAGHLEGALHADLESQLSAATAPGADPARGGRHPLPSPAAWAAQLGAWGIGPETPVVVGDLLIVSGIRKGTLGYRIAKAGTGRWAQARPGRSRWS